MTIKDYLAVVRQRWLVALVVITLTTSSAVLLTLRQPPLFEGTSRLLVIPLPRIGSGTELTDKYQFQRGVATEAEIVKSAEVATRVIERLNLQNAPVPYDVEELIEAVEITVIPYTDVLEINVRAPHPELAAELANAFPEEYIKRRREQAISEAQNGSEELAKTIRRYADRLNEIDKEVEPTDPTSSKAELLNEERNQLIREMSSLESTRQALIDQSPLKNGGVGQVIQHAQPSPKRANGDVARTAALGFIIGLPLALGLALLLDSLSDTVKSKEEAERIVGVETLGVIPLTPEWRSNRPYIVSKEAPYSAAAEAYRTLRVNIDSKVAADGVQRILFTSPGAGEGKSTATANIGVAYSEAGRTALMLSADLRRPNLHRLFDRDVAPGLTEFLRGQTEAFDVVNEVSQGLYLIPSGTVDGRPEQLINRAELRTILEEICVVPSSGSRPRNDENGIPSVENGRPDKDENLGDGKDKPKRTRKVYTAPNTVLLDSSAVLGAAEVSALAPVMDGVVLVLRAGITRREAASRASEQIRRAGGKLLGIVLVGVKVDDDYSVYPPAEEDSGAASAWSEVAGSRQG